MENNTQQDLSKERAYKDNLQKQFCQERGMMPFIYNGGECSCGHNIYDDYSDNECSTNYITGCRKCGRSYCE